MTYSDGGGRSFRRLLAASRDAACVQLLLSRELKEKHFSRSSRANLAIGHSRTSKQCAQLVAPRREEDKRGVIFLPFFLIERIKLIYKGELVNLIDTFAE